jgi:hypothetical protein
MHVHECARNLVCCENWASITLQTQYSIKVVILAVIQSQKSAIHALRAPP